MQIKSNAKYNSSQKIAGLNIFKHSYGPFQRNKKAVTNFSNELVTAFLFFQRGPSEWSKTFRFLMKRLTQQFHWLLLYFG